MRLPHSDQDWTDAASESISGLFRGHQPRGRLPYWGRRFIWAELAKSLNRDMKTMVCLLCLSDQAEPCDWAPCLGV